MSEPHPNVKSIFDRALEIEPPEARGAYLDQACAGSPDVRRRVEALLQAYHDAGRFLQPPALPPAQTVPHTPAAAPPADHRGTVLAGRYKLLEQIGEGGMGTVYVAEQTDPVRRRVAVKLIRLGMDSRAVLARFEAERQALAVMDHPNIARVFDAGATGDGRPFFVMELVKGVPITRYGDENHLTVRQRLELFIPVCQAIQHAHQKGVIHRDIKPTNVLVALYDGRPVPKVIDFGVAKAAGEPLTERTLYTGFGTIVGTPEYMSPEQATFNQLDIDTRSDVYALGVLLYELLTGTTPVDQPRLRQAAVLEVLRVVREEEPPRPSVKLTTDEARASIAATRGADPRALARLLRGELDWIVMKALEKDRNRRYDTAVGFARDIERYLRDEMVEARPPTLGYRLRKWATRKPVIIGTIFLMAMIPSWGWAVFTLLVARGSEQNAILARKQAEARRAEAEVNWRKAEAATTEARANEEKARQAAAETSAVLSFYTGMVLEQALTSMLKQGKSSSVSLRDTLLRAEGHVAATFRGQPLLEAAVRMSLGGSLLALDEPRVGRQQVERAFAIRKDRLGPLHPNTIAAMKLLASTHAAAGDVERGGKLYAEAMTTAVTTRSAAGHDLKGGLTLGLLADAAAEYSETFGGPDDAIRVRREAVRLAREALARDPKAGGLLGLERHLHKLGQSLMVAGRPAEAEPPLRESWQRYEHRPPGRTDWFGFVVLGDLGSCLVAREKHAEAEPLLLRSFDELKKRPEGAAWRAAAAARLVRLYESWGKPTEVARWRNVLP